VLEREARANLVYRNFTRVGFAKMPDAKTMGRWVVPVGRRSSSKFTTELCVLRSRRVLQKDEMRVDTTVIVRNIHYPTDSSLLGNGVRADPRHAEDHRHRGRSLSQTAGPPERKVPGDGDWSGSTSQRCAEQGKARKSLRQFAHRDEPRGRTGRIAHR
jgi:hypothetical protein